MKRTLLPALLIALAATGSAAAADADKAVARHLDKLGYTYEVDEDGDYRMVFDVEGDRTQMVYVRSSVEDFGTHRRDAVAVCGLLGIPFHFRDSPASTGRACSNTSWPSTPPAARRTRTCCATAK